MVGENCEAEWLGDRLAGCDEGLLILDCRSIDDYRTCHVLGSVHMTVPTLMLRRLDKGNLPVESVINCQDNREKLNWKSETIVLLDESTDSLEINGAMLCCDMTSSSTDVMKLLLKRLKEEGRDVFWLRGGFESFRCKFPQFCVSSDAREMSESTILGLRYLHLTTAGRGERMYSEDERGSCFEDDDSACCSSEGEPPSPDNSASFPVEVLPHLYLGDAKNSADLENLYRNGIKYILNVTPNVPNKFEKNEQFRYMQIPISDHWSQNLTRYFPEAIAFIDEARRKKCGVLVHCLAGISRSVTITVAYLMHSLMLSLNDAYDHVKRCKPNISPNFNFMGQLMDYERSLRLERDHCTCHRACNSLGSSSDSSQAADLGPCLCHIVDSRAYFSSPASSLSSLSSTAATSSSSSATSASAFEYELSSTHS